MNLAESQQHRSDAGITTELFGSVKVTKSIKQWGHILIYHWYTWREGVTDVEEVAGMKIGLTRLTINILLPGPTVLD